MGSDKEPFNEDSHYAAVGRVASLWAGFELDLDIAAITLALTSLLAGFCFTSQIQGASRKLDAYIALVELRLQANNSRAWKPLRKELNTFAKDTQALGERRNRTVHDPWYVSKTEARRLEVTARRKLRFLRVYATKPEMDKLVDDINIHKKRFEELRDRIKHVVDTLTYTLQ
jgi:hypothetical protein